MVKGSRKKDKEEVEDVDVESVSGRVTRKKSEFMARYYRLKRYSLNLNAPEVTAIVYEMLALTDGDAWLFEGEDILKILLVFGVKLDHVVETAIAERNLVTVLSI